MRQLAGVSRMLRKPGADCKPMLCRRELSRIARRTITPGTGPCGTTSAPPRRSAIRHRSRRVAEPPDPDVLVRGGHCAGPVRRLWHDVPSGGSSGTRLCWVRRRGVLPGPRRATAASSQPEPGARGRANRRHHKRVVPPAALRHRYRAILTRPAGAGPTAVSQAIPTVVGVNATVRVTRLRVRCWTSGGRPPAGALGLAPGRRRRGDGCG